MAVGYITGGIVHGMFPNRASDNKCAVGALSRTLVKNQPPGSALRCAPRLDACAPTRCRVTVPDFPLPPAWPRRAGLLVLPDVYAELQLDDCLGVVLAPRPGPLRLRRWRRGKLPTQSITHTRTLAHTLALSHNPRATAGNSDLVNGPSCVRNPRGFTPSRAHLVPLEPPSELGAHGHVHARADRRCDARCCLPARVARALHSQADGQYVACHRCPRRLHGTMEGLSPGRGRPRGAQRTWCAGAWGWPCASSHPAQRCARSRARWRCTRGKRCASARRRWPLPWLARPPWQHRTRGRSWRTSPRGALVWLCPGHGAVLTLVRHR